MGQELEADGRYPVQGQAEQSLKQPALEEGVPSHGRDLEVDEL